MDYDQIFLILLFRIVAAQYLRFLSFQYFFIIVTVILNSSLVIPLLFFFFFQKFRLSISPENILVDGSINWIKFQDALQESIKSCPNKDFEIFGVMNR